MAKSTITAQAAACADLFQRFLPKDVDPQVSRVDDRTTINDEELWAEDQMTLFNMWATNLGVFASGHASIEHRLRDCSEVYNHMLQFLGALHANLLYVLEARDHLPIEDVALKDESYTTEKGKVLQESPGSDSDDIDSPTLSETSFVFSSASSSSQASSYERVATARLEVEDAIHRLSRLSTSVRQSGSKYRNLKAESSVNHKFPLVGERFDFMEDWQGKKVERLIMEVIRDQRFDFDNFVKDNQHLGMEDWQKKEVERLIMEGTRDPQGEFDKFNTEKDTLLATIPQSELDALFSKCKATSEDIRREITDNHHRELFEYAKGVPQQGAASTETPTRSLCDSCRLEIAPTDTFWSCLECAKYTLNDHVSEIRNTTGLGFMICHTCYLNNSKHDHDTKFLMEVTLANCKLRQVFTHDIEVQHRSLQEDLSRKQKIPRLRFTNYQKTIQIADSPISVMLRQYLKTIDINQCRFVSDSVFVPYKFDREITIRPRFQLLQNWALACLLLADHDFFRRTKTLSFIAFLSPIQRASIQLLKEWWLSEIQDPKLMQSTIVSFIADCIKPDNNRIFDSWTYGRRDKYHKHYHGAMEDLFDAEFSTYENGRPTGTSTNLFLKRTEAGKEACIQRMAYSTFHPSMKPPWWVGKNIIDSVKRVEMQCDKWTLDVKLGCIKLLLFIRMIKGPEDICWALIDITTRFPSKLFIANCLFNEQIFGPKRLSATLAPLPWLPERKLHDSFPHYLWDVRNQRTVEVRSLGYYPHYIAVSHTWGRWKRRGQPSLEIEGVPWPVPQNDLWDVSSLPQQLRMVPGRYRFVWFDLVCIPQDVKSGALLSQIERSEVSKQAAIFGNAIRATMWLSTVERQEMRLLQDLVTQLAMTSGRFESMETLDGEELEELQRDLLHRQHRGSANATKSVPLVREDRRSFLGTSTDPLEFVHPWFTSLWTLQEACMRPDMWICGRDWTPLRIRYTASWRSDHNLSLDGILALLDRFKGSDLLDPMKQFSEESIRESPFTKAMAELLEKIEVKASAKTEARAIWEHSKNPEVLDRNTGQEKSVEEVMRTGESADIIKGLPTMQHRWLNVMFIATGIGHLLSMSPMDILVLADQRQCKRSRAEAIMSAIGAVDWYEHATAGEKLILDRYPISFIEEIRTKVGNGEFFRSRCLNRAVERMIEEFMKTGELPHAAGTALPFGIHSSFEVTYSQLGCGLVPEQHESHPSLQTWRVQLDASVTLSQVGILASTQKTMGLCECLNLTIEEVGVYHEQEEGGTVQKGKFFDGHPEKWLNERQDRCYLVCVDWLERYSNFSTARVASYISRGLVLQELKPGYFVKICSYMAKGHKEHVFPRSDEVEWTIL